MAARDDVYRFLSSTEFPEGIKRKLCHLYETSTPATFNYHLDRYTTFIEDFIRAHARPVEPLNSTNLSVTGRFPPCASFYMQGWNRNAGPLFGHNASVLTRRMTGPDDDYIKINGMPEDSQYIAFEEENKENFRGGAPYRSRDFREPQYHRPEPRLLSYTPEPPGGRQVNLDDSVITRSGRISNPVRRFGNSPRFNGSMARMPSHQPLKSRDPNTAPRRRRTPEEPAKPIRRSPQDTPRVKPKKASPPASRKEDSAKRKPQAKRKMSKEDCEEESPPKKRKEYHEPPQRKQDAGERPKEVKNTQAPSRKKKSPEGPSRKKKIATPQGQTSRKKKATPKTDDESQISKKKKPPSPGTDDEGLTPLPKKKAAPKKKKTASPKSDEEGLTPVPKKNAAPKKKKAATKENKAVSPEIDDEPLTPPKKEVKAQKEKPGPSKKRESLGKEAPQKAVAKKQRAKPSPKKKPDKIHDPMRKKQAFDDSGDLNDSLSSFLRSAKRSVQDIVTETPPTRALNSVILELSDAESSEARTPVMSKPKNKKWVARVANVKGERNVESSPLAKKPKQAKKAHVSKEVANLVEAVTSKQLRTPEPLRKGFESSRESVSEFDGYGTCESS